MTSDNVIPIAAASGAVAELTEPITPVSARVPKNRIAPANRYADCGTAMSPIASATSAATTAPVSSIISVATGFSVDISSQPATAAWQTPAPTRIVAALGLAAPRATSMPPISSTTATQPVSSAWNAVDPVPGNRNRPSSSAAAAPVRNIHRVRLGVHFHGCSRTCSPTPSTRSSKSIAASWSARGRRYTVSPSTRFSSVAVRSSSSGSCPTRCTTQPSWSAPCSTQSAPNWGSITGSTSTSGTSAGSATSVAFLPSTNRSRADVVVRCFVCSSISFLPCPGLTATTSPNVTARTG
jgi:hypothetical protein